MDDQTSRSGSKPHRRWLVRGVAVALVAGAIAGAVYWLVQPPLAHGPVPVAWDRAVCAHCRMHVGDPAFAVQLQTREGRVLNFDDPGCFFLHVAQNPLKTHRVYFHHHQKDQWIARDEAAFVEVQHSPMGFQLGAVEASRPGAIPLAGARKRVLARTTAARESP